MKKIAALVVTGLVTYTYVNAEIISGLTPSQRPQGAPSIKKVVRAHSWYARALHGVEKPYPRSIGFLEDQGNWHNPFTIPGMTGPYDIRGWHKSKH